MRSMESSSSKAEGLDGVGEADTMVLARMFLCDNAWGASDNHGGSVRRAHGDGHGVTSVIHKGVCDSTKTDDRDIDAFNKNMNGEGCIVA
jgi:hypothetical protein